MFDFVVFLLPSSSSESTTLDELRFHLKLRNGLFDRSSERRLPIFNEPPDAGVRGDEADDVGVDLRPSNPLPSFDFLL